MSLDIETSGDSPTSLGDDDSFELTFGETLAGSLIIPGLVQMWSALKYPYEAQDDITRNQHDYGCL